MALQEPVYVVQIHGPGRGYHEAYAALERSVHLPIDDGYLVFGDEARVNILAHDREGDVRVTARLAGRGDVPGEDETEADTVDIERFIERISGAEFHWDDETSTWSLPGYEALVGGAHSAVTRREGVLAALAVVLAIQKH